MEPNGNFYIRAENKQPSKGDDITVALFMHG